jgi:hypothetical protein
LLSRTLPDRPWKGWKKNSIFLKPSSFGSNGFDYKKEPKSLGSFLNPELAK